MIRALLSWKSLAAALLATIFLATAVPPLIGENPPKPPLLKAKVFQMNYCDPTEMEQVLQGLLDPNDPPQLQAGPAPMNPPMPGAGIAGFPGPGGIGMMAAPGGFGALGFGGITGMPTAYHVTVDSRTRSLVVRASEKNLQLTADLISVLDLPKGKPMPEVRTLKALPLKHADAGELQNTLQATGIEARMVGLPEAKLLVVAGTEEAMKEVADLVKDLDAPTPPELKPEQLRKLFSDPNGM
ncbi:MAG TPA: secretin N-terminal domain-containing protein [Gemmataceae bacterium]|jgi:hypothetical protein|nr:secretin N-terminal domain-containing protein [Gemmataceae bacterium]